MVKIHLADMGVPEAHSARLGFRYLAQRDETRVHILVDNPADADATLFVDCHLVGDRSVNKLIRQSNAYRTRPDTCIVYDERDRPWCEARGLYVSMPARTFRPQHQIAFPYYTVNDPRSWADSATQEADSPDLLFSFIGSATHRSRRPLFNMRHPRSLVREVNDFVFFDPSSPRFNERRHEFATSLMRSKFVLCPRGQGTSSIRCYETLAAGRVPVVISDDWVPPGGIDWSSCSLRWPENVTAGLIELLEEHEPYAADMGRNARLAFERTLAPEVMFDRIGNAIQSLLDQEIRMHFPTRGFWTTSTILFHAARANRRRIRRIIHPRPKCG
jgi:hypothetical protein